MYHSPNFTKWLKKHKQRGTVFAAFSGKSVLDGGAITFSPEKTMASQIIIGFGNMEDGFVHGSRLSEIICNGAKAQTWAYGPDFKLSLIDGWMKDYEARGVCHIDPEHVLYADWVNTADHRRHCCHCGFKQVRHTSYIPKHSWAAFA